MDPKIQPAPDAIKVGVSSTEVVPEGKYAKGIRVNAAGVLTITTHAGSVDTWDVLKGERLDLGGNLSVTTDGTAEVFIYI